MRKETIYNVTRKQATKQMPWAAKIAKVDGGYIGFESVADYNIWRGQK